MRTPLRHLLLIPVELKRQAQTAQGVPVCDGGLGVAWWRGLLTEWLPHRRALGGLAAGGSG